MEVQERTGILELEKETPMILKMGLLKGTTTCCATGTCKSYVFPDSNLERTIAGFDSVDAVELANNFGYIN